MKTDQRATDLGDVKTYFTGLASLYAEYRPTYPTAAIEAILQGLGDSPHVADIGCGTGISSRLLAASGARVTGIDPNIDMLEQARHQGSSNGAAIDYRQGSGEHTGLANGAFEAVVCAQSFHWFDAPAALREFSRILKPRGRLALMWNVKDEAHPFTGIYWHVAEEAQQDAAKRGLIVHPDRAPGPLPSSHFHDWRVEVFDNPLAMSLDGVLGRARSASYFPKSGPLRDEFESRLRAGFERHQRDGTVIMQYRTEITFAIRL